jgi:hypothetical protein
MTFYTRPYQCGSVVCRVVEVRASLWYLLAGFNSRGRKFSRKKWKTP